MGKGIDDSLGAGITQKEFSEKVGHDRATEQQIKVSVVGKF